MKKLIAIVMLAIMLVVNFAQADVEFDLSYLSLDELVKLQNAATLAMWNTDEWQEVRIPAGVYKIGESIPEGTWTIKPVEGGSVYVRYSHRVNEAGTEVEHPLLANEILYSPTRRSYSDGDRTELTVTLLKGRYIEFNYDVIFTTPVPATFNFKK